MSESIEIAEFDDVDVDVAVDVLDTAEQGNAASTYDAHDALLGSVTPGISDVPVSFTTGPAGTGKTYGMKMAIEEDPRAGILCATTGVAAVNLGTVTLNSVLKYFDTDSLADLYQQGRLQKTLAALGERYRSIMIDEISMMEADQLDIIYQGTLEANGRGGKPLAIQLTGDFCQLPPVKGKWAFEATHWEKFAANTTRLTKMWRQKDEKFLNALNAARAGDSKSSSEQLRPLATWGVAVDNKFEGTTIMSKNVDVDRYNTLRYMQLKGREVQLKSSRWGQQRSEWKLIPAEFKLKVGSYVMILANATPMPGQPIAYANGDCGWIQEFENGYVLVKLVRNGNVVRVPFIERKFESKESPKDGKYYPDREHVYLDNKKRKWVYGAITYMPVRLAYAATVHKTQGLTLDAIQLDIRGHFFGSAGMAYVALSRVKTPEGLRIVGSPELLERRINVDPKVLPWI